MYCHRNGYIIIFCLKYLATSLIRKKDSHVEVDLSRAKERGYLLIKICIVQSLTWKWHNRNMKRMIKSHQQVGLIIRLIENFNQEIINYVSKTLFELSIMGLILLHRRHLLQSRYISTTVWCCLMFQIKLMRLWHKEIWYSSSSINCLLWLDMKTRITIFFIYRKKTLKWNYW